MSVIEEAERSHPVVTVHGAPATRTHPYAGAEQAHAAFTAMLPVPRTVDLLTTFGATDLRRVRGEVGAAANRHGIAPDRTADLALAIHELAANSVRHAGGAGVLRIWLEPEPSSARWRTTGRSSTPSPDGWASPARARLGGACGW